MVAALDFKSGFGGVYGETNENRRFCTPCRLSRPGAFKVRGKGCNYHRNGLAIL